MRLRESCPTPHHPMRASLPTVICTTAGMSKITFQKSLPKTSQIILLPLRKNKTVQKFSRRNKKKKSLLRSTQKHSQNLTESQYIIARAIIIMYAG